MKELIKTFRNFFGGIADEIREARRIQRRRKKYLDQIEARKR